MVSVFLTLWETAKLFPEWLYLSAFPSGVSPSSNFFASLPKLGILSIFNFSHSNKCLLVAHMVLICISLITNDG